jgi:hypothetical protein
MTKFYLSTSSYDNLIVTLQPRPRGKELTVERACQLFYHTDREFTEEAAAAVRELSNVTNFHVLNPF